MFSIQTYDNGSGAATTAQPGIPSLSFTTLQPGAAVVYAAGGGGVAPYLGGSLTVSLAPASAVTNVVGEVIPAAAQDITTSLAAAAAAGSSTLPVVSATGLYPGANLVLDYGTVTATGANPVLAQEAVTVASVSSGTNMVTLAAPTQYAHTTNAAVAHYADNLVPSAQFINVSQVNGALPAPAGGYNQPEGVAIDSAGTIYVADTNNNAVETIVNGTVTAIPPPMGSAGWARPHGVASTSVPGVIFIANTVVGNIYSVAAGQPAQQFAATGIGFVLPGGVAVDAGGDLFVADTADNRVMEFPSAGGAIPLAAPPGGYNYPGAVAVDGGGNVYVADTLNSRVVKVTSSGAVTVLPGSYKTPYGVTVSSAGNVYVADTGNSRIVEIAAGSGAVTPIAGVFSHPYGVAWGGGNVYVADTGNNRIVELVGAQ